MMERKAMIECYRRWFEYETDAHAKVVRSLESVPIDRRSCPEYCRAVTLLGHIVGARRVWLHRLGAGPAPKGAMFPENADLAEVVRDMQGVHESWTAYLAQLADADINNVFEYQSYDSGRFRNRVEDVLTQMFTHSSYHRGQIAILVKQAGGTPAATDFIYWCREPAQAAAR